MQLTPDRRQRTGAFYTPPLWADKAVSRLERVCPCLDHMVIYDPAAGEGALLDAVRRRHPYALTVGTTLESEDASLLDERGHVAAQFDFLQQNTRFLPEEVHMGSEDGNLVVFTNPPFLKLPAAAYPLVRRRYPSAGRDATALFLLRALRELHPLLIATFHKLDIYQSPQLEAFRRDFRPYSRRIDPGFIVPAASWPRLKGCFPIAFSAFFAGRE